jgi:hypothetical protein
MRPALRFWWVVGGVSVLALWTSSGVYLGTTLSLIGPEEPDSGGLLQEYVGSYLAYRRALFSFEQWQNWALTLALLGIGLLAAGVLLSRWDGRPLSVRLGALAVGCGAVVAAVAQVAYLGAVERVFAVGSIAFFDAGSLATMVDVATRTDDYVEDLGFLVMAAGLIALAWTRDPWGDESRVVRTASGSLAVGLVAATITSFMASALADPMLLAVGFIVAPTWAIVMAGSLDAHVSPRGTR